MRVEFAVPEGHAGRNTEETNKGVGAGVEVWGVISAWAWERWPRRVTDREEDPGQTPGSEAQQNNLEEEARESGGKTEEGEKTAEQGEWRTVKGCRKVGQREP